MRLVIERDAGQAALARLQSVVSRKANVPILGNVLLQPAEGCVRMTATDLDAQIAETVDCDFDEPGETTVEAGLLFDLFRNFPPGGQVALSLTRDDPRLVVSCGRATYRLPVLPSADFPVFKEDGLTWSARVPGPEVKRLLDCTAGFVGHDQSRPVLMGVHLHARARDGALQLVAAATDAHHLGTADTAAPEALPADLSITLPPKSVAAMQRLIDGVTGDVEIAGGESLFALRAGRVELVTKLIDIGYPDYQRTIPTTNERELRGKRADLMQAVKRVALVADRGEKFPAVRLRLESGRLTIKGWSADSGQAVEEIDVEYDGGDFEIGFNGKLLLETLGHVESVNLRMSCGEDASTPALIYDDTDPRRLFLMCSLKV